jgi:mannose-1-phosphate guanylyltransferase/mannose-1-phosphate guanylyltransferase/mannose-6-phosphate isomerase
MEKTDVCAVLPLGLIGWSDVGSFAALYNIAAKDAAGNVAQGDVVLEDVRGCLVRADAGLVAALGVRDLVVIATADAVLVAPRARAQDMRRIVQRLGDRPEALRHAGARPETA